MRMKSSKVYTPDDTNFEITRDLENFLKKREEMKH